MTDEIDFSGVSDSDIAVVGMAAHLPGAADVDAFWRNLRAGIRSIRTLTEAELLASGESAARLSRPRAARLHAAVRDVLGRAVEKGGSTLRDFSGADGQGGYFQLEAMVYGRAGQPCRICSTSVRMFRQGQRSTFFCPVCQKP